MENFQIDLFKEQLFHSAAFQKKWKIYVETFGEELNGLFGDNFNKKISIAVGLEHLLNQRFYDAYHEIRHFESACLTDSDKKAFDKLLALCLNEEEMAKVKVGDWIKRGGIGYCRVMKKTSAYTVIKKGFDPWLVYVKNSKQTENFFTMLSADLKTYQSLKDSELSEIKAFFLSHPEEEKRFLRNTEKMLAFREEILRSDFKEALYDFKQFHFYRYTTEKAAFVLNLKDCGDDIQIAYGFTSIPEEEFFKNHGEDDDNIKLRFLVTISNEKDETLASQAIKNIYNTYCNVSKDDILTLKKERQKQFLQKIAVRMKPLGFKKKGAKWTKLLERDFCLEFEAQKSQWSDAYYFNVNVYHKDVQFPRCYETRLNMNGNDIFNWQLMTEEELNHLLNEAIENILTPIIRTPLAELGTKKEIWKSCICSRAKCNPCWVQKTMESE